MELYERTNIFLLALEIFLIIVIGIRYLTCKKEKRTDVWSIENFFLILMLFIVCILSIIRNQIVAFIIDIVID